MARLERTERDRRIRALSTDDLAELAYSWEFWARPEQLAPRGSWSVWLVNAGRGWGKSRTGAEWIRSREACGAQRIALVTRTAADGRDVVVEGESGILATSPPWHMPRYEPSKRRLTWPARRARGGADLPRAIATLYSAEEPNLLRGPQHDTAWGDELASWPHEAAFDNLMMGLRLGNDPRGIFTTTPRPIKIIRGLMKDANCAVTRGSTFENRANLPATFLAQIVRKYENTRLGRQEIFAEVLDDAPGALWRRADIDAARVEAPREFAGDVESTLKLLPPLRKIAVGVDPAVTSGEESNLTGIIVCGVDGRGHGYVLEDASGRWSPLEWADKVAALYVKWSANIVVAEVNQGGDLVESNIRATRVKGPRGESVGGHVYVAKVRAAKGKRTRAEPVASLYEQGRVHHVGLFGPLEDELTSWEPDVVIGEGATRKVQHADSPDRLDALVWALTEILVENPPGAFGRSSHGHSVGLDDMGVGI